MTPVVRLLCLALLQLRDTGKPEEKAVRDTLLVALAMNADLSLDGALKATELWVQDSQTMWNDDPDDDDMEAFIYWREQLVRAALGEMP